MTNLRVLLTFGTRPEAIKMAPVALECRRRADSIEPIICVSGQHREMLAQVTGYFGIHHDVDLNLMTPGQTLAAFMARCLTGLDDVLARLQPDCLVAQGDTTTVMAAVPYAEFVWLMDRSTLILTDSGGIQEEAPSLGRPVLVMRDTTERPEAIEAGVAELVGTSVEKIVQSVCVLLTDPAERARRGTLNNPYGDGHSAERIVDLIVGRFGR